MKDQNNRSYLKERLDEAAHSIPNDTASKLHQARQNALAKINPSETFAKSRLLLNPWTSATTLGVCGLLTIGALSFFRSNQPDSDIFLLDNDTAVLTEELQLLEDLEFYQWMLNQDAIDS